MKKLIIPLIFALAGTSFVAYSFLDTFVIQKKYGVSFNPNGANAASNFFNSFGKSSSSKTSSSVSNSNSSSSSSSSSQEPPKPVEYYEDLTEEEINALFTPEVVFEPKKHYSDPDIYIDITTDRFEDYSTYYAADIRIKDIRYLKTALANDTPGENITEYTSQMCIRHKGIIAVDGDTYGSQKGGYVIRNGQVIRRSKNTGRKKDEDLVIYWDGRFEIINENEVTIDQLIERGAWQVFSFGPGLISEGKKIVQKGEEVGTAATQNRNQRCAIGMIAPLHYIFVVSDGRIASSPGLSLYQIGKIMEAKHAYCAYNLDGGGSATMYFDDGSGNANGQGALVNYCTQELVKGQTLPEAPAIGERGVSDCVYIGKE